ncbi:MAG: AI-2E family transporter [Actinomycetota bacterium]|nr:AI-2E family transporter [Actinomycetota bacterium]
MTPNEPGGDDTAPGSDTAALPRGPALVPRWFLRTVAYCAGLLVVAAAVAVLGWVLMKVSLVTIAVLLALLLAALLEPLARLLRRVMPAPLAALLSLLVILGVVGGTGYLLTRRVTGQIDNLTASLTAALGRIRNWLVTGPLSLQPQQVDQVRAQLVGAVRSAAPSGFTAASMVISVLTGVVIVLFVLFFLIKDGRGMWHWVVGVAPARHRARINEAGRLAWATTGRYVVGVVVIALIDAVAIGTGLFVIGVPLALSLTILIFLGAFVPLLGATVSGAVAVLVTLVTNGLADALIVLGLVLVVQNLEGNLLQPLIQGRAVRLHPVVILVAVTAGFLLFGIAGAVIVVPVVAVTYRVATYLRDPDPAAPATHPPT